MREETSRFLRQAEIDLDQAGKVLSVQAYNLVAFLCHQAIEKYLKALHMALLHKAPPRSHELPALAKPFQPPEPIVEHLKDLNPDFALARYPDAANGVPADMYTCAKASDKLRRAKEIVTWIEGLLPK